MRKGFTLIEMMLYVALFAMLLGAVGAFVFWTVRTQAKVQSENEVVFQAQRAKDIMTKEIQEAVSIYTPTSVFALHPGQFSLETKNLLPQGETATFVDFFLCQTQLCMKRESQDPLPITSDRVIVQNFTAAQVMTGDIPSLRINLRIAVNPSSLPEYRASIPLTFTASLRAYETE
ncbi:MAG: prepilin-type N-terminal cleavage/methylation domain-containing protein [Candidatus Wildermuthbacteria bacterium]|nr:prepilin-type N-terminal cleavage/methylation domain-containing protein [Candidatus Wildermuthbacteria bacterium]